MKQQRENKVRVHLRLDPQLLKAVRWYAQHNSLTVTAVVVLALNRFLGEDGGPEEVQQI